MNVSDVKMSEADIKMSMADVSKSLADVKTKPSVKTYHQKSKRKSQSLPREKISRSGKC